MDADLLHLLLITLFAAVLANVSMVFGVVPFLFLENLSRRASATLSALAAGMMAVASLVQLTGEGLRRTPGFQAWEVAAGFDLGFAAGAMVFLVIDDLLPDAPYEIDPTRTATAIAVGAIAMILLGRLVGI